MKVFKLWPGAIAGGALLAILGTSSCVPASSEVEEAPPAPAAPAPTDAPPPTSRQLLPQGQVLPVTAAVELNGQTIRLEVARTAQQQAIGLMARESLPDDRGMLFPFEPARPVSFWMKNVLIPLDMVFIADGTIVAISSDVPPCEANPCPTYGPEDAIDYVLELRGGLAADLELEVGTPIDINWLEDSSNPAG
ncbi:MAG TPA: DUF192 domain-containing protein [Candidatus Obscuribacterales bacterium]